MVLQSLRHEFSPLTNRISIMFARSNHMIASFWRRNHNLLIAFALGTTVFVFVTGGKILNPANHNWLMVGDSAQHYFGGAFFRHTPIFQWPIGKNRPFGMELSSSIVFTDSIPAAALIAKLFGPILPHSFQYLGIWIWGCFVLQAQLGQLLLRKFLSSSLYIWLGTCFLLISPPFTYRLIHQGSGHIALASQWLILAAFILYFRSGNNTARWAFLISLCWLIQAYFVPMVAAVWLASLLQRIMKEKKIVGVGVSVLIVAMVSVVVMWSIGYFMIGSNFNPDGWNYVFRWQPLSLVDSGTDWSMGWSHFLPNLPQLVGDTEGFSFLGVGVLALAYICVYKSSHTRKVLVTIMFSMFAFALFRPLNQLIALTTLLVLAVFILNYMFRIYKEGRANTIFPLLIAVLGLALYSMTNRIGFGQRTMFEYPLFTPLKQFTETFRTHGRSIWPAYYLLVVGLIVITCRSFSRRTTSLLLALLLAIQLVDSLPAINSARSRFTISTHWSSPFTDSMWKRLSLNRTNIIVVPPLNNDEADLWMAVDDFAINHGMNTNSGYFSRYSQTLYDDMTSRYIQDVQSNNLDLKTIYIINDEALWNSLIRTGSRDRFRGTLNGFHVIAP